MGLLESQIHAFMVNVSTFLGEVRKYFAEHILILVFSAFASQVWDLHLNDPDCRGTEVDDSYVFSIRTNLSDCGTVVVGCLVNY